MTEKRMKILHVLTDRNIGGAGRWLLYYLKYHNREKFAVQVVLPHDSLLVAAVQALDVPVLAMEEMEDKSFDRKAFKALAKIFRAERPDIVHTACEHGRARMAARRARVPYIFNTNTAWRARRADWQRRFSAEKSMRCSVIKSLRSARRYAEA